MINILNCFKHFKLILKHKYYVLIECFKMKLYWQGITHDLSKFTLSEFLESAYYFQGNGSPVEKAIMEKGYSSAWLKHKGRNKHHWQFWVDFRGGRIIPVSIPNKYLCEMCADIVGASKSYLKGNYNPEEPLNYFNKHSVHWIMKEEDKEFVKNKLKEITK